MPGAIRYDDALDDPAAALTCSREMAAANGVQSDPAAAARRQRVLRLLEGNPNLRLALITDIAAYPV
jgi:hypothetical protein